MKKKAFVGPWSHHSWRVDTTLCLRSLEMIYAPLFFFSCLSRLSFSNICEFSFQEPNKGKWSWGMLIAFQSTWSTSLHVALHSGLLRLPAVKLFPLFCDGFLPVWLSNVFENWEHNMRGLFFLFEGLSSKGDVSSSVLKAGSRRFVRNVEGWGG